MPRDRHPVINISPIAKVSSLASLLSIKESDLLYIAANVDRFHRPGKELKKRNGEPRQTHDAEQRLKIIHGRINNRILKKVDYPYYLQGGIADKKRSRGCRANAIIHSRKKLIITEDIKDFFPCTSKRIVKGIWQYCFRFHPEIADILTRLTIYQNQLPQGWKTSSYLANLVFWDKEPDLVSLLEQRGYSYSRYMDDITVSSGHYINNHQKNYIISKVYEMLFSKGFAPKRSKHEIVSQSQRMDITGLVVNRKNPTVLKSKRRGVRVGVFKLEELPINNRSDADYRECWEHLSGLVSYISAYHPKEGKKLRARLRNIKPNR
ncbi:MAG: RNA-directed DNA polymerase [Candidatus Dadabacteria bacterium]|nr:RNA-directed DNA polymerase [Candidatus Dadabacteria bacterium]MYE61566.1 RNA-directed DNA polymerase [Candidatus Dadabacteria bacterium]